MPSAETPTPPSQRMTPGEQTLRQWYQGRLAMTLMQGASMEKNRQMLRRGAMKQQDGTLGEPGEPAEEEPVNISIGDTYQVMPMQQSVPSVAATPVVGPGMEASPAVPAAESAAVTQATITAPAAETPTTPLWKQAAAVAAILAGMGGSAGLASYLTSQAEQPAAAPAADTNTEYQLRLNVPPVPTQP